MKLSKKKSALPPARNFTIHDQMKETKASDDAYDKGKEKDEAIKIWDCGSPLYDSYELVSLSHVIDRHTMVLPSLSGSRQEEKKKRSDRLFYASNTIPSLSSSSIEANSKKFRVSAVLTRFSKLLDRNFLSKRRIGEGREKKPRKLITDGIHQASTSRK